MWWSKKQVVQVRFQLLEDHDGGEIPDYHGWFLPGRVVYDDQKPMGSWISLECDNPTCSGRARISLDDIRACPLGVIMPDPPGTKDRYEAKRKPVEDPWLSQW